LNRDACGEKKHPSYMKTALFPAGRLFATRRNFESGFNAEERRLAEAYLKRPCNVLIIGSGNGREARPISADGHKIVCIDKVLLYLQCGQRLSAGEGMSDVGFLAADMHHLPFRKASFDFVFFSLYSIALDKRFEVIKEIREILRPGGLILLSADTTLHRSLYRHVKNLSYFIIDTVDDLQKEVSQCGFDVLEGRVNPLRPEYLHAILRISAGRQREGSLGEESRQR